MPDSPLADVRRTMTALARGIVDLPEVRPSHLPPAAVDAIGDLIRACDWLIAALSDHAAHDPEADDLLAVVRAQRRLLVLVMAGANPEQAGFWTEDYKDKERATDAKTAAGLIPRFYSDQDFEATLRARWLGETDQ